MKKNNLSQGESALRITSKSRILDRKRRGESSIYCGWLMPLKIKTTTMCNNKIFVRSDILIRTQTNLLSVVFSYKETTSNLSEVFNMGLTNLPTWSTRLLALSAKKVSKEWYCSNQGISQQISKSKLFCDTRSSAI